MVHLQIVKVAPNGDSPVADAHFAELPPVSTIIVLRDQKLSKLRRFVVNRYELGGMLYNTTDQPMVSIMTWTMYVMET